MFNCLKYFDILKEGLNCIVFNNIFICVMLYFDIYMIIFMYIINKFLVWYNVIFELFIIYNGCIDLNYIKYLIFKFDYLIIQDIKNII